MASMVVKASSGCTQATSLSVQEKGSRNKRKFHADPPLSDPCGVLSLPNDADYEFSADEFSTAKYKLSPVHGQVMGCDLCGVKGEHSDALKLDLGLSSAISASDVMSGQSGEEREVDEFHDADWSDLTENQLEELVLSSLDAIFKSAIFKIISHGYTQDVATRAVLRSGLCYGSKDIVSNIVNNTLAYLKNSQEADPSKDHCFEDLQQLERYVLVELVCILQAVRPFFSTGDALWCLLLCDMNVSHACAMEADPLSNFLNDGVSNASSFIAPQPELKPEAIVKDTKSSAPSKPTPKVALTQGSQLGKDSLAKSLNLNKKKIFHALHETNAGKESLTALSVSMDKSSKGTMMQQTTTTTDKAVPSRKHSNSTKRESVLRQKSSPLDKNHRTYDTKGVSRAAKLSGLGGLILDRKLRESAGINLKNASIRMKALGVDLSISQAKSTISISTNSMPKSGSSKTDELPTVSACNSKVVLSSADTEHVLSLPAKSNPPPVDLSKSEEVPKCSYPVVPFDKSLGQWVPQDKKDEMIIKLYPRLRELQNQLNEWTEWANQKVMQAARRLSKDKAELKMLRQEREEVQRLKKEKQTLEDSTMKKLSEMENALSKASSQVERANSAVRRLEVENRTLRQEMEAAKMRAADSATSCQEAIKREKKTLTKFHSWEKQKAMFEEELAAERRKLTQLQKELELEKDHLLQLEVRWKQEEKAKDELLAQAQSTKQGREQLEASTKSKEESIKSKAETNLQRYKDDIKKLEKEISQLRLKTDSFKIAALKMGIDGSYPNKVTPAKTISASESQSPYKAGVNGFQEDSGIGGVKRERECVMCLSEEMSVVFLPCAHQVVCTMCNELHEKQGMKECPSCRSAIQRRICVRYARA
ncbi:hypothetical protein V2J09_023135 [Rumex salicifolius]